MSGARRLHIVITAGPTREPIDPVRFVSNYSTGYMGARLAAEALARGHRVTVIHGPVTEPLPSAARTVAVERSDEMARALRRFARTADVIMMAAAVADFRPIRAVARKLPRRHALTLTLNATPDLIGQMPRRAGQLVAGFALETHRVLASARRKLRTKRLDVVLAQEANGVRSPFGRRPVRAWLLTRDGSITSLGRVSKGRVARLLLDKIETLWYGQTRDKTPSWT